MTVTARASIGPEWMAAARLVRRTGFGATGSEVDAVVPAGRAGYLAAALAADSAADQGSARTPVPEFEPIPPLPRDANSAAHEARHARVSDQLQQLIGWWLRRMIAVDQPIVEK